MATFPVADPDATTLPETLAIRGSAELQATLLLTLLEEPSEYVAVAVSWVVPPITTVGSLGEIESEVNDGAWPSEGRKKTASSRRGKQQMARGRNEPVKLMG